MGFSANHWQDGSQQHLWVFTVQLHYAVCAPHGNQSQSTAKIRLCLFLCLPCGTQTQASCLKQHTGFVPCGWNGIFNCALLPSAGQATSSGHLSWWAACLKMASSMGWSNQACKATTCKEANVNKEGRLLLLFLHNLFLNISPNKKNPYL